MIEFAEAPQALLERIDILMKEVVYYQDIYAQAEQQCAYLRGKIEEIEADYEKSSEQINRECAYLRSQVREMDGRDAWRKSLDTVSASVMSPSQKDTTNRLLRYIDTHPELKNADGYTHLETWQLAPHGEQSLSTLYTNINYVSTVTENGKSDRAAIIPLFDKRIIHIPDPLPFKPYHYREETYIKTLDLAHHPEWYEENCTTTRQQGGAGRGQGRKPKCEQCGKEVQEKETVITKQRSTFCPRCNITHVFPVEQVNSPLPTDDLPPDDGEKANNQLDFQLLEEEEAINQLDFQLSSEEATDQLDAVIPTIGHNQVDCQLQDEYPVTPPPRPSIGEYPLNGFTLEDWLARRRGHGPMIYSTGILDQAKKYLHKPAGYTPDIAAYIRGDLQHIYGSRPALEDGTTYLFGGDCDTPELDAQHLDWMTQLAAAGIPSIYWLRRPGRGHLEVYTDTAVDRKAFYAHLLSVCPGLAAIPECFPIGRDQNTGGDDRSDFPYSWPCYYRVGNQVVECAAEVRLPGDDFTMVSPGIQSDRNRLTWLISRAIVPAATIPALPLIKEETRNEEGQGGALLDIRRIDRLIGLFDDGVGKAVIADFNATHTWEQIADVQDGWFLASWREEHTPSVKINGDGTAHDFGKTGRYPNHLDKFEAYCLINGLNKSDELKRRIAAYQERVEVSA